MLGRVEAQGSLLEARVMDWHLLTRGSVYERLAEHGHEVIRDEDFAHCYSQRMGRPSIPPSVMMRAVLLATHDRCSDAEASRRTRVDLDWKAALGVDRDFRGIGATTFSLFRIQSAIPFGFGSLQAAHPDKDGVAAITAIRNDVIHPKPGQPHSDPNVRIQAWRLSQWYTELAILRSIGYQGTYSSRLRDNSYMGEVEKVPWA